jgi:uncharacterized protein
MGPGERGLRRMLAERGATVSEDAYESLIRRAYRNFESGDLDLLGVVMAQDVMWHEPGRSSFAGHYSGPEEVLGFLRRLRALSGGTFSIEVLDVLSEPERAVVLQRETAVINERTLDVIAAVEVEVHHGKITEVTVYHHDTYAFDEFWTAVLSGEGMDDIRFELEYSAREAGVGTSL